MTTIQISEDDAKILAIVKKFRQTVFEAEASVHGFLSWYTGMCENEDYFDKNTMEQRFLKADLFNRVNLLFSKLVFDTKLTKGCEEPMAKNVLIEN